MALFHVETLDDPTSDRVLVEIRRDAGGALLAHSGPVYASHEEAEERVVEAISKAWPEVPVDPVYPAGGS